jgi:hypothetical protein
MISWFNKWLIYALKNKQQQQQKRVKDHWSIGQINHSESEPLERERDNEKEPERQ